MKDFLDNASAAYYNGNPLISDEQFDVLADLCNYQSVGHQITDGIKHYRRMYSLSKVFDIADVNSSWIKSPKLDGAAISLLYVNGSLELALTRGDGKVGRDITSKMMCLVNPQPKGFPKGVVQITGEVVAPKTIPNARNYAAGALNLKDMEEFTSRDLTFVAYDVTPAECNTWTEQMAKLETYGFQTVLTFDFDNYPTDGLVYRTDSYKEFESLGFTSHHPRGAVALKTQKEGEVSTLEDVVWQVGKSGVVSPVGLISPVVIDGATVRRVTLHNMQYIRELGLEIGCQVEVIRSGDIIPRIVRRIT